MAATAARAALNCRAVLIASSGGPSPPGPSLLRPLTAGTAASIYQAALHLGSGGSSPPRQLTFGAEAAKKHRAMPTSMSAGSSPPWPLTAGTAAPKHQDELISSFAGPSPPRPLTAGTAAPGHRAVPSSMSAGLSPPRPLTSGAAALGSRAVPSARPVGSSSPREARYETALSKPGPVPTPNVSGPSSPRPTGGWRRTMSYRAQPHPPTAKARTTVRPSWRPLPPATIAEPPSSKEPAAALSSHPATAVVTSAESPFPRVLEVAQPLYRALQPGTSAPYPRTELSGDAAPSSLAAPFPSRVRVPGSASLLRWQRSIFVLSSGLPRALGFVLPGHRAPGAPRGPS